MTLARLKGAYANVAQAREHISEMVPLSPPPRVDNAANVLVGAVAMLRFCIDDGDPVPESVRKDVQWAKRTLRYLLHTHEHERLEAKLTLAVACCDVAIDLLEGAS